MTRTLAEIANDLDDLAVAVDRGRAVVMPQNLHDAAKAIREEAARLVPPLRPAVIDTNGIYARAECTFMYCSAPDVCRAQNRCANPHVEAKKPDAAA